MRARCSPWKGQMANGKRRQVGVLQCEGKETRCLLVDKEQELELELEPEPTRRDAERHAKGAKLGGISRVTAPAGMQRRRSEIRMRQQAVVERKRHSKDRDKCTVEAGEPR